MAKVLSKSDALKVKALISDKHPGTICIANYKGGVGKTTLVCLLGYYLAERTKKKVLLFDIDPQCSLSLAVGFDPEEVSRTELTVYNLVKPSKWSKIKKTKFANYVFKVPDSLSPKNLFIIRGSFNVDELDMEIAKSIVNEEQRRIDELFLYCKQMLNGFEEYDYILVDCPPNKMFLTQAMLRACSFYLPVTILDLISVYGMPRLLRWVKQIPASNRPRALGYVLNAINRIGGVPGGKVYSQQSAESRLENSIMRDLEEIEKNVLGNEPLIGVIPRLDAIARFLSEQKKFSRYEFSRKTSNQPTIEECLIEITDTVIDKLEHIMPKKEFFHKGGNPVTGEIKILLGKYFHNEDISKIERFGGRIIISLSIPYRLKKKKNAEKIIIDKSFIASLREIKTDKKKLDDKLAKLNVKELRQLGRLVGYPLRTKSPRQEILDELISCFNGEDIWRRITESKEEDTPTIWSR